MCCWRESKIHRTSTSRVIWVSFCIVDNIADDSNCSDWDESNAFWTSNDVLYILTGLSFSENTINNALFLSDGILIYSDVVVGGSLDELVIFGGPWIVDNEDAVLIEGSDGLLVTVVGGVSKLLPEGYDGLLGVVKVVGG